MLLDVLTRCYKRPHMLRENIRSMLSQTDQDFTQMLLVDGVGIGVAAANARLAQHSTTADYVWVLDDDDACIYPQLVEDVRRIARQHDKPPVIIVCMDHGAPLGVLPDEAHWQAEPAHGHIGVSAFVVRGDVWNHNCHAFASGNYHADYDFIRHVWRETGNGADWHWHPVIASKTQNGRSVGATE